MNTEKEIMARVIYYLHKYKEVEGYQKEYYYDKAMEMYSCLPAHCNGALASIMQKEGLTTGHCESQNW